MTRKNQEIIDHAERTGEAVYFDFGDKRIVYCAGRRWYRVRAQAFHRDMKAAGFSNAAIRHRYVKAD